MYISVILESKVLKVCFLWSSRCHCSQEAYVSFWVFSFCFMALTEVLISPLGKYYTHTHKCIDLQTLKNYSKQK